MAKIGQLVDAYSKIPGDIRIRHSRGDEEEYFIPFFVTKNGTWCGLNERALGDARSHEGEEWELHSRVDDTPRAAYKAKFNPKIAFILDEDDNLIERYKRK